MTFVSLLAGASLIVSLLTWRHCRRNAKRLEQISQMYWELKYQHGELRARLQRLGEGSVDLSHPNIGGAPQAAPTDRPAEVFVPLTSLRR